MERTTVRGMTFRDLKRHLVPYRIYARRKTTINHAFAAAVAPCDEFIEETVRDALRLLGQDPESELKCVYCDSRAETWDHVFATVKDSVFSGAGHRLGNLLPCCKACNSMKGNRSWRDYIISQEPASAAREYRIERLQSYLERFFLKDKAPSASPEYSRFIEIRDEILRLMQEADDLATAIRERTRKAEQPSERPKG